MELSQAQIDKGNLAIEELIFGRNMRLETEIEILDVIDGCFLDGFKSHGLIYCFNDRDSIIWPEEAPRQDMTVAWNLWNNREGNPWQEDLEAHIERYRKPARNFFGDLNLCFEMEEGIVAREVLENNRLGSEWPALYIVQLQYVKCLQIPILGRVLDSKGEGNAHVSMLLKQAIVHSTAPQRWEAGLRTFGSWPV